MTAFRQQPFRSPSVPISQAPPWMGALQVIILSVLPAAWLGAAARADLAVGAAPDQDMAVRLFIGSLAGMGHPPARCINLPADSCRQRCIHDNFLGHTCPTTASAAGGAATVSEEARFCHCGCFCLLTIQACNLAGHTLLHPFRPPCRTCGPHG